MIHRLGWTWTALLALTLGDTAQVTAQVQLASRAPRFVRISPVTRRLVDASHAKILKREMSLSLDRSSLAAALDEISRTAGINLIYSRDLVPLETPVTLQAAAISLGAALTAVLFDTGLDVAISSNGEMALMKKAPILPQVQAPTGSVSGRVTEVKTGAALAGATVLIERTSLRTTTDSDGRYRIAEVVPGTYTLRARYIGYAPGMVWVTVSADQEITADFALERSVQRLAEVVTTGTVLPTEVKALPTPVSVISESEVTLQRPRTVQDLFRQAVPGSVSWDVPSAPYQTPFSARGATVLGPGGQMKVFVDGVEVANPTYATVDPSSIGRMEVIRGPQAAAIYGSDAIGGVIQVFTKRHDPSLARPQVDAEAALGILQTPYAGFNGVLRQGYRASVRGGGAEMSYTFGAGYSHTGDWLPNGEQSAQSNPSVYGSVQFGRGLITADVSGRYYAQNVPSVVNPEFSQTGFVFYSKPLFQPTEVESQALGARINLVPTSWWRNTVSVGIDQITFRTAQSRPRLTSPEDTLLFVSHNGQQKKSIGFTSSLESSLGTRLAGSLTVGVDHYSLPNDIFFSTGALNTTGGIRVAPGASISAIRDFTNNTGYFAQAQIGFRDALFITGGLRAEQNSNFGDSLGTPISPRVGMSFVQSVGRGYLKFRGSYGRAIRAPAPGQKVAGVSQAQAFLANPVLGPERQKGWDTGVDAEFGDRGSLSLTYYHQTADGLIQAVLLQSDPVPTFQFQNAARVKNSGLEVEGTLRVGPAEVRAQYGYTKARIEQLAPNYAGNLRVGDQASLIPKHTAGASATVVPLRGMTVAAGLTYVGSWTGPDFVAQFRCFGGTGPCQPTLRDYDITYPGFLRINASVSQQITALLAGFVAVDNLTDNGAFEAFNLTPVMGRISTVGLQIHY